MAKPGHGHQDNPPWNGSHGSAGAPPQSFHLKLCIGRAISAFKQKIADPGSVTTQVKVSKTQAAQHAEFYVKTLQTTTRQKFFRKTEKFLRF
ncbi:MAG: hypothetical protein N2Z22_04535, partial [Turneriella sp.]|nr:hypothetical protein [Turneriella sp.]